MAGVRNSGRALVAGDLSYFLFNSYSTGSPFANSYTAFPSGFMPAARSRSAGAILALVESMN